MSKHIHTQRPANTHACIGLAKQSTCKIYSPALRQEEDGYMQRTQTCTSRTLAEPDPVLGQPDQIGRHGRVVKRVEPAPGRDLHCPQTKSRSQWHLPRYLHATGNCAADIGPAMQGHSNTNPATHTAAAQHEGRTTVLAYPSVVVQQDPLQGLHVGLLHCGKELHVVGRHPELVAVVDAWTGRGRKGHDRLAEQKHAGLGITVLKARVSQQHTRGGEYCRKGFFFFFLYIGLIP